MMTARALPGIAIAFGLTFAGVGLPGCGGDAHSRTSYPVRTDPLLLDTTVVGEQSRPETPGQLPLTRPDDVRDPKNPLYKDGNGTALFKGAAPKLLDPTRIPTAERTKFKKLLDSMFGSPNEPKVELTADDEANAEINASLRDELKLDPKTLTRGARLYRVHCAQCHGATGDGRGPAGRWLIPHPRDYRPGLFKFQSVDQNSSPGKPRRADLYRTIELGLDGTSMPAFNLLSRDDLDALVSYVIHLSMRGEAEQSTITAAFRYNGETDTLEPGGDYTTEEYLPLIAKQITGKWLAAQQMPIEVGAYPYHTRDKNYHDEMRKSVQRGRAIFIAEEKLLLQHFPEAEKDGSLPKLKAASCIACHKDYGRQANWKLDVWGTMVRPADLTTGIYRGGRRPTDLYYRIHSGINGSGMLSDLGKNLTPGQIWDVVNFLRVLPDPKLRQEYGVEL